MIYGFLQKFTDDEKIIIWTQMHKYEEWIYQDNAFSEYDDVLKKYYDTNDISEYLLEKVRETASNYTNTRIENY